MKNFIIIDGKCYKIVDDKVYAIKWDYKTGNVIVASNESDVKIPEQKYTYNEVVKKFNVRYYVENYEEKPLEVKKETPKKKTEPIKANNEKNHN